LVIALISGLEGLSSLTFVLGLNGLSSIGVWDVLGVGTHDRHGISWFPSATNCNIPREYYLNINNKRNNYIDNHLYKNPNAGKIKFIKIARQTS